VLFVAALIVLASDVDSSMSLNWFAGATFVLLLVASGTTLGYDLLSKRMKLRTSGKVLVLIVLLGIELLFFAPAIQTMPGGGSSRAGPTASSPGGAQASHRLNRSQTTVVRGVRLLLFAAARNGVLPPVLRWVPSGRLGSD